MTTRANDLLLRARRCRRTADAMQRLASVDERRGNLASADRRRALAANLEACARSLFEKARHEVAHGPGRPPSPDPGNPPDS
jgi:hypothetical protein